MKLFPLSIAFVFVAIGLAAANALRQPAGITALPAPMESAPAAKANPIARKPRLVIAFRLDQELTRSVFLGDRWVSPPSYDFAQPGTQYVALAKAQYVDELGERTDLGGDWSATNPEMVALTPGVDGQVTIVVRRPGESELRVNTGRGSRNMHVRARQVDDGMRVEFKQ